MWDKLGASSDEVGMLVGGLTASTCVMQAIERGGLIGFLFLVGFSFWGLLGTHNVISKARLQRDRAHKLLGEHKLLPTEWR